MEIRFGITMRVTNAEGYDEPRDSIARDWSNYFIKAFPESKFLFIPNIGIEAVDFIKKWDINVLVISGGDNIGETPQRDETEIELIKDTISRNIPIIAVCRGFQLIHKQYGGKLTEGNSDFIKKHRANKHNIIINNKSLEVNSYHVYKIDEKSIDKNFNIFARCVKDDSVEGFVNDDILAMMWHPERDEQISKWNKELIVNFIKKNMKTKAIILAAGRGSRMGDATASKPKCLNVLNDKCLLDWQLLSLRHAGIEEVTVVRGYRSDMLQGDFNVVDNKRWSETNMVSSLFCVSPSNASVIISYSDIVYDSEHVRKLNDSQHDITITADKNWENLWKLRFEDPLDDAETFKSKGDFLQEIGGKTDDINDIEAQYMGLIKLTPKGWKMMSDLYQSFSDLKKDKMDMTSMLNELLGKGVPIQVVFVEGKWCEADSYSDILAYEKELDTNKHWEHDWR